MDGELSPAFAHSAVQALAELLPDATRSSFPGADHGVRAEELAPELVEFFGA